ncbi:Rpn family recombination-promoting nuclease/putative transposase [Holdemania filiformis]|uniref:Rpn family recombination-promoting nuclease/putative transposase n=1 Tax=Holdemania filiformis TaxID=61171 RepID=A0A412G5U4_9FIRM|nr:Rpn family recombination-promoting nuclease/putative transposase [Holdemania filiformis]RGR76324.1 Rpn family recombination-promoting nuclease/putative transposase [Holdemania filiformis]
MSIDLRERKKLKKRTISLMDDWVFKAVIGDPEDEVCLSSFFHAIDPDFRKVRLLPGEKKAGHPDDKAIRYDICGVINEKIYFDLEIQRNGNPEEQGIRIVFYLSRLLSGQRTKGKDYRELRPVRVIMITNSRFFDDPEVSSDVFYLVGEKTGRTLTKHIQVSIIELAGVERLQRIPVQDLTPLDRWRIVLKFAGDPDKAAWIQAIMAIDEGCRRAVEKMMEIPMSMIEYMWETKRLDREMMRNSEIREERERAVKKARERALKQGKDQGVLLNLVTIVLKKAKKGMRAAEIADMLEEEEARIQTILKIKEEHPDYTEEQIAMKMISESVYPATLRNKERLNEENGKFPLA